MKPDEQEHLKLISLSGNQERYYAYLTARALSNGLDALFGTYVRLFGEKNIPRFLGLVAKAWEEKRSKYGLTPTGEKIYKAWRAAYHLAGRTGTGFKMIHAKPTLLDIKMKYAVLLGRKPPEDQAKLKHWIAELERQKAIPADQTFRTTLNRCKLPYH